MALGNSSGNLLLGAFVGFTITVVLTPFLPIVGHLIGGFVAGLIAKGEWAGERWWGGSGGHIWWTRFRHLGNSSRWDSKCIPRRAYWRGFLGGVIGVVAGLVVILASVFGAILAAIGGLIGGAIAK